MSNKINMLLVGAAITGTVAVFLIISGISKKKIKKLQKYADDRDLIRYQKRLLVNGIIQLLFAIFFIIMIFVNLN